MIGPIRQELLSALYPAQSRSIDIFIDGMFRACADGSMSILVKQQAFPPGAGFGTAQLIEIISGWQAAGIPSKTV